MFRESACVCDSQFDVFVPFGIVVYIVVRRYQVKSQ